MIPLPRLMLAAGLGASTLAAAQQPPQVWMPPDDSLKPIVLEAVSIDIAMHGFLARTRIEMTFANPNARVLEGEFVFPLAPGQTVSGYALEVDGALREGVVVPKETARVAFEDTVRGQIDPGLTELTRGNVFRTRLYPIPANGHKRIALSFEQVMEDAGTHWRYLLPLQFRQDVKRFSVHAEAPLASPAPELASDSPDPALHFTPATSVWRAGFSRENITPQRELAFRVPKQDGQTNLLEARDAREPRERAILAQIDTGLPSDLAAPAPPQRIALFFDASGSARDRDLARERAALAAWLATLDRVEVELVAFRDSADAPRRFALAHGNSAPLLEALAQLPLDGASNYGAIDFSAVPNSEMALLVGDGLDTFGTGQTDFSRAPARLFALHAAQRVDALRLDDFARHGGSRTLDLTRIDAAQAAALLAAPGWQLLSLQTDGDCRDIAPATPRPAGAVLPLAARCTGPARLTLHFGTPDGRHHVSRTLELGTTPAAEGAIGEAVWRAVAAARIAELQNSPASEERDSAITALALRHGVVTAQTSLLVLDRVEDYVRYGIEPGEPALRERYRALLATQPKPDPDADQATRLASLAARWRQFRDWHAERHAWLETLLAPAAQGELALWRPLAESADARHSPAKAGMTEAHALAAHAQALAERWPQEGSDPTLRARWEREAIQTMLRLDALRERRLEQFPASPRWQNAPDPLPPPTMAPALAEAHADIADAPPPPSPAPSATAQTRNASPATLDAVMRETAAPEAAPAPMLRAAITLAGWDPQTPYLASLRDAKDPYAAYLQLRDTYAASPSFFLDAADFFREHAQSLVLARRVLSNLAEIGDDNTALVRVLGYRLMQWDEPALALRPFEEARQQRPEEPQSHRDLALALARLPQPQSQRAAQLLWHVATGTWSPRFPDIDLIALHELSALVAAHPDVDTTSIGIPPEWLRPIVVDLRVVLTWDADNTDIDLWVIDPTGEAVYYAQPRSKSGGLVSRDVTQGYGPEVFTIARPLPGTYRVQAHYFGDRRQSLTGPVTVQVEFQTGFGRSQATYQAVTRRLESGKQRIDIGQFRVVP